MPRGQYTLCTCARRGMAGNISLPTPIDAPMDTKPIRFQLVIAVSMPEVVWALLGWQLIKYLLLAWFTLLKYFLRRSFLHRRCRHPSGSSCDSTCITKSLHTSTSNNGSYLCVSVLTYLETGILCFLFHIIR